MANPLGQIKNTVWHGAAIGLLAPLLPAALVWYGMQQIAALKEADLLLVGCVAINAFLLHYFFKQNKDQIGQGIVSITFLWALAFFFYKVR